MPVKRTLPTQTPIARVQRRVGGIPHGLPTAVTFSGATVAVVLGSVAGAAALLAHVGHPRITPRTGHDPQPAPSVEPLASTRPWAETVAQPDTERAAGAVVAMTGAGGGRGTGQGMGGPAPTPVPTATAPAAPWTPSPSPTPSASDDDGEHHDGWSSSPTPVATASPFATPRPTATPGPTATAEPTDRPERSPGPTPTPVSTASPRSAWIPAPTAAPSPTPRDDG